MAGSTSPEKIRAVLSGTRWLLVANDAVSSDGLACALRDASAQVRMIDPGGLSVARLGAFDAQVVLSERGQDLRFLRERIAGHPVLRWAAQLSLAWSELWSVNSTQPELGRLAHAALPWLEPDRALARVVRGGVSRFEVPLDRMGPVRALRVLCSEQDVFRAQFKSQHERGYVEVAGELVVSASFELDGFPQITGVQAFARVLELPCVRATVERRVRLSTPTLSLPFEKALELAVSDIRERDGSDSPTLRMASPLSLLEPDAATPTPTRTPSIPSVAHEPGETLEPTTNYRRSAAPVDSGVLTRDGERPASGSVADRVLALATERGVAPSHAAARARVARRPAVLVRCAARSPLSFQAVSPTCERWPAGLRARAGARRRRAHSDRRTRENTAVTVRTDVRSPRVPCGCPARSQRILHRRWPTFFVRLHRTTPKIRRASYPAAGPGCGDACEQSPTESFCGWHSKLARPSS